MLFNRQSEEKTLLVRKEEIPAVRQGLISRTWRGKRRWIALFILILLVVVLYWVWWAKEQDVKLPGVVSEVIFSDITPIFFQDDHLYFSAKNKENRSFYVLDLQSGRMVEENWTKQFGDYQRSYQLVQGVRLSVENRSLILKGKNWSKQITSRLFSGVKQPLSISPEGKAFIYATEDGSSVALYLYVLGEKKSFLLEKGISIQLFDHEKAIQWSDDGKYVLVNQREVFQVSDGNHLYTLPGSFGVWIPGRPEVSYIAMDKTTMNEDVAEGQLLGKQIFLFDVETKKQQIIYETNDEKWLVKEVVWDPTGEVCVFVTGRQEQDDIFYEEVHVMDRKLFHFIESEQNLIPSQLTNLRLSTGGQYLSYEMNGILKLINLQSQESRVYDVYNQGKRSEAGYIHYDENGVWLAQNHTILFVAGDMEEKEVYRTPHPLLGFYLSSKSDKLLVIEEVPEGRKLRLIDTKEPTQQRQKEAKGIKAGR